MTHFNESSEYWGDRAQKIIGASNGRLTARSVKIFADGMHCRLRPFIAEKKLIQPYHSIGALRTGGAAVSTYPLIAKITRITEDHP